MLYLSSDDELQYAVLKCLNNAGFKVIIAFDTSARRNSALDTMRRMLADRNDCRIRSNHREFQIEFQNGSYLRSVVASQNARGHRSHLLIIDDAIDRNIVNEVLRPYETLQYNDEWRTGFEQHIREHPIVFDQPMFTREYLCKFDIVEDNDIDYPEVSEAEFLKLLNA